MREEDKIKNGILFDPSDPELVKIKLAAHNLNLDYNKLYENETEKRQAILKRIVGKIGEESFIQGPLYFHYGVHTFIGHHFFANFNLTIQDDAEVKIGDYCNFGPNVTIVTPLHPLVAAERTHLHTADGKNKHLCYAKPVSIGNRCWIGTNVTICPGVTIGDDCVIGAGSVVTRDIPPNSLAFGVPCKVQRLISEKDSMIYMQHILGDNEVI